MIKQISKQLSALLFAALLMLGSTAVCFAVGNSQYVITDDAELFTDSQIQQLADILTEASNTTGWQYIVHTDNRGISSSNMTDYYNREYYDTNDFESDAIMFVYDFASDGAALITHGDAMQYISDERLGEIGPQLRQYLREEDYYGAVSAFAEITEDYYESGVPDDGSYSNIEEEDFRQTNKFLYVLTHYGIIIAIVALAAGGATFGITAVKYKLNGKSGTYDLRANSKTIINEQEDIFVSKHTTVHRIESSSGSSGGSSSGSSSSGGSTHGGGSF